MTNQEWANRRNWYALLVCILTQSTINSALQKMGIPKQHIYKGRSTAPKHPPELVKEVKALRDGGMSYQAIAENLDLTRNQVVYIYTKLAR